MSAFGLPEWERAHPLVHSTGKNRKRRAGDYLWTMLHLIKEVFFSLQCGLAARRKDRKGLRALNGDSKSGILF